MDRPVVWSIDFAPVPEPLSRLMRMGAHYAVAIREVDRHSAHAVIVASRKASNQHRLIADLRCEFLQLHRSANDRHVDHERIRATTSNDDVAIRGDGSLE